MIDALIYGRDLGPEGDDFVSEERFSKIRFYLKHGKYPNGADRAEKSRLRSAATHYKLVPGEDGTEDGERLMLKDKEVVSDLQRQYDIAQTVHLQHHGGINKTTAAIAEKYHWVRIKETVSLVIRNCVDCKEMAKVPPIRADGMPSRRPNIPPAGQGGISAAGRVLSLPDSQTQSSEQQVPENETLPLRSPSPTQQQPTSPDQVEADQQYETAPINNTQHFDDYSEIPLDPQIMEDVRHQLSEYNHSPYTPITPNDDPLHTNQQGHLPFTPHQNPLNPTDIQSFNSQQETQIPMNGQSHPYNNHNSPFTSSQDTLVSSNGQLQLTNYQALLSTDSTQHHQSSIPNPGHHPTYTTPNSLIATKASAAARAAQQAMGQTSNGSLEEEDPHDCEMKRQLLGAGYGVNNGG